MKGLVILFTLIILTILVCQIHCEESIENNNDTQNSTISNTNNHGIHLVSWRWNDYSQYFVVCIMIMLAAVVKVLFHEIPILYKHFPESCVLIVLGVILGIIVYFGVDREGHHFPE